MKDTLGNILCKSLSLLTAKGWKGKYMAVNSYKEGIYK